METAARALRASVPPPRAGIVTNMAWLAAGSVAVKPLWFLFTTVICIRALGPSGYGAFVAAVALAMIVAGFSDWGLNDYTVREIARAKDQTSLFSTLLTLRIGLAAAAIVVTLALGWWIGQRGPTMALLATAALYTGGVRLLEFVRTYYRAFEVLRYESVSVLTERLIAIASGTFALGIAATPASLLLGLSVGTGAALLGNVAWVHLRLAPLAAAHIRLRPIVTALRGSFPLGVYGALSILFLNIGTVLLERMAGTDAAGQYGAAYRFVEVSMLLPSVVVAAVYPRLVALHTERSGVFWTVLWRWTALAGVAASGVATVTYWAGPTLLQFLTDDPAFARSGDVVAVVTWQIPLMTVGAVWGAGLMALGSARALAVTLLFVVPTTVALNILLVPALGAVGSATALVVGQGLASVLFLACLLAVRRNKPVPLVEPS